MKQVTVQAWRQHVKHVTVNITLPPQDAMDTYRTAKEPGTCPTCTTSVPPKRRDIIHVYDDLSGHFSLKCNLVLVLAT